MVLHGGLVKWNVRIISRKMGKNVMRGMFSQFAFKFIFVKQADAFGVVVFLQEKNYLMFYFFLVTFRTWPLLCSAHYQGRQTEKWLCIM